MSQKFFEIPRVSDCERIIVSVGNDKNTERIFYDIYQMQRWLSVFSREKAKCVLNGSDPYKGYRLKCSMKLIDPVIGVKVKVVLTSEPNGPFYFPKPLKED